MLSPIVSLRPDSFAGLLQAPANAGRDRKDFAKNNRSDINVRYPNDKNL
jgi:hypothetical protein